MTAAVAPKRRWPWVLAALLAALVGAFLLLRTPDVPVDELKGRYASPQSQFLEVSPGFFVHVRDEGLRTAPALFLVHGSNASLHTWEPWVERLKAKYRIVSLDLQGHGLTGPIPSGCYTTECMAGTVEAVRAKLGIDRLAIAGNSMGGGVSIAYALAHPDRVSALVLVDAGGAPVERPEPPPIGFRIASSPLMGPIAAQITPRGLVAETLEQSVSVKSVASPEAATRYWELLRRPGNREATMDRWAQGWTRFSAEGLAPLKGIPVLILWGAEDRLIPVSAADWFKEALPQSEVLVYPKIGHIPHEEAPDRSAADLAAFLTAQGIVAMEQLQTAG
jgi:pimeloyl-ACP methyl ester carboxylesterase